MSAKKKAVSDFRYDTGKARIPWAAVGETVKAEDIMAIIRFLLRLPSGARGAAGSRLARIRREVAALTKGGHLTGKLTLGNRVKELETQIAKFLGVEHAVFVSNCTAGFEIAYKAAGLKPGDEVIAPAITFIASIAYPLSIGAKVVLADVDPRTLNLDPRDVARKVTRRTRVIIPVHMAGYPVDMDPIMRLARKRGITVIEDAAHAFGGKYKGRMIGSIGDFGGFSFHEVKNITALGEGGILVTNSDFGEDFAKARFLGLDLSRQIPNWLYDVVALKSKRGVFVTGNHSATEIQAVGLLSQMKRLKTIIAKRKQAAEYLNRRFKEVDGIVTPPGDDARVRCTYHLYLLQIDPRKCGGDVQALKRKLQARGVVEVAHFAPLYKFSIMRRLGYDVKAIEATCPAAEEAFRRRFTHLPLYDFSKSQLRYLADTVIKSVNEMKAGK